MRLQLLGIIIAVFTPILHGWANILDSYFVNDVSTSIGLVIFVSELSKLLVVPLVVIIDAPHAITITEFAIVALIALIEIAYQYPYYGALQKGDTSVVASLFSLGKLSIPLFAYLLVGERLTRLQYVGFLLIITASIFLTIDVRRLRLNDTFLLMALVSVVLSLQTVLYKYLFQTGVSWSTAIVWTSITQCIIAGIGMISRERLPDLTAAQKLLTGNGPIFLLSQCFTWSGSVAGQLATYIMPVSIVSAINSTQPIVILVCAVVCGSRIPRLFREQLETRVSATKIALFMFMVLGALLITVGS
jgi:drug/metabolite transporter (DMT)-like permease